MAEPVGCPEPVGCAGVFPCELRRVSPRIFSPWRLYGLQFQRKKLLTEKHTSDISGAPEMLCVLHGLHARVYEREVRFHYPVRPLQALCHLFAPSELARPIQRIQYPAA